MSSSQTYSPFHAVLLREWRRMTSRRLYFGVCIILPLFTLFFMATIFGNGQMENIPVGIVDQDNTASSRAIVRNISAVPTFKVTKHFVMKKLPGRPCRERKFMVISLSLPDSSRMPYRERMRLSPIIIIMRCFRSVAN